MTLFRESDKKVFARKCQERNQLAWSHADWEPEEMDKVVEYSATAKVVSERLEIMGFTLTRAQDEFETEKARYLEDRKDWDFIADELALIERSTFPDFIRAFEEILTSGVHPVYFSEKRPEASELARYILKDDEEFYWGFPCRDIRSFFRILLEIVPQTALVIQDITDLVAGGYYEEDAEVCEWSIQALKGDYAVNSKIILLTEGPTDSEVLKASLELLYPHLSGYYSFMDLAVRSPGGAGSLVHVVKSFAGAGIENRTIALFDNDATGHSTAMQLRALKLPSNIRVINYPNIALALEYLTSGPNGNAIQDINGSACSIELYYGRDVLTGNDGALIPVRWKGFDEKVKRYQGEIQLKDALKERFLAKVRTARLSGHQPMPGDWDEIKQLFKAIFDAFK
jgi:hypothetical protein